MPGIQGIEPDTIDVPVVENPAPRLRGSDAWSVGDEPVVQIGSRDGAGPDALFRITEAVRLSDGRIAAWSAGDQALLYFDSAGSFVGSVGGRGGGPGEFEGGSGMTRLPGDTLCIYDLVQQRVTLFDEAGDLAGVTTFRAEVPLGSALFLGRLEAGPYLLREGISPLYGEDGPGLRRSAAWISRVSATGDYLGRVVSFEGAEQLVRPSGGVMVAPFGRTSVVLLAGDRLVIGFAARWKLEVYDLDGALRMVVRREGEPVPVTRAERERYRDELRRRPNPLGWDLSEGLVFPETHPVFDKAVADVEGNVWVRQYQPGEEWRPRHWSVFGPTGEWITDVTTPERFQLMEAGADYVLGVWRDDLEVEYLRLYRLDRGGA